MQKIAATNRAVPAMEDPTLRVRRAGGDPKPPQCHAGKEPGWEATAGNGSLSAGQVSDEKTNVSESLITHRNRRMTASKPGAGGIPGTKATTLVSPSARKRPACCPGGARCRGGVSSSQALAGNRRTCRPDTAGQSKWVWLAPWSREGGPRAAETASGRVPMRGTGAGRLVVAVKVL